MENLAYFIHEEIFLIQEDTALILPPSPAKAYRLGVIADVSMKDDEQLLNDILKAIKIDKSAVVISAELTESSPLWLVFAERFHLNDMQLLPTKKMEIDSKTLILAQPLKVLRDSKHEKAALWLILKEEFGL